MPGSIPPVRMAPTATGQQPMTPPPGSVMGYSPHAGAQVGTPSKIDPNQIPRPVPSSSALAYFETRQGTVVSPPPVCLRFCSDKFVFQLFSLGNLAPDGL
jgi:protein transport protein SEC24